MDERSKRVERFFAWPVMIAALLVIPVIVVEYTAASDTVQTIATVLNWAIWIMFAAELAAMLWVVPNRWRWLLHNPIDVIVVVFTPPVLPPGLQSLRALRLLRLLRLLKLAEVSRRVFSLEGLRYAAVLAVLTVVGGGAAFAAAQKQNLDLWDGVYWAFSTMTTADSGIQPDTTLSRIIAMAVVIVGISLVALLTGAFAERFLGPEIKEEVQGLRKKIGEGPGTIDSEEARVLTQIRTMAQSLQALEREVQRLARRD